MNFLFVHNNFPAQFRHAATALVRDPAARVAAIGCHTARSMRGVKLLKYALLDGDVGATHPFARRFDLECRRAEQVMYALTSLQADGFVPDAVVVHAGWGESLPIRAIFPKSRLIVYCEYYYGIQNRDVAFDPEFPTFGADGHVAVHLKNAATLLALSECDHGLSPTYWQRSTYPKEYHDKIAVIHEGVDVSSAAPDPDASFRLPSGRVLTRSDEVITFVARNLEPLRGYHMFMRALPRILEARPRAHALVVGGNGTSYGAQPQRGQSWHEMFLQEVADRLDLRRVHFTGRLPYADYLRVLQVSSAHVYLTYPFVLSWSLIEALSTGCVVIGSDTPPVREVIDGRNGILVPFFDTDQLAEAAIEALAHPRQFADMRVRARRTVLEQYDVERKCLPQFLALLRGTTPRAPRKLQRASVRRRAARRAKRRKGVWHGVPATRGRGADAIRD
jgi:glycosyltransferase involved in cell wall biosynthesis